MFLKLKRLTALQKKENLSMINISTSECFKNEEKILKHWVYKEIKTDILTDLKYINEIDINRTVKNKHSYFIRLQPKPYNLKAISS